MGMIKRIFRQTSSKLLAGIGVQRHRLVLNGQIAPIIVPIESHHATGDSIINLKGRRKKRSHNSSSTNGTRKLKKSSRDAALLLAAKNYLPPVQFHHVHGKTAQISNNGYVARRTQSFCQALVFSNRIILPNERVYIKVLELAKGWSGTIRFGFTSIDPATLAFKMPKHVCPDMTNAGHTWARALADDVVRKNSVIHFSYDKNGFIHYGINNQDCGKFCANVNTSQHLWFVVDVYGLTTAVELIDPRAHNNATGEFDLSHIDIEDEQELNARNLIFKTNATIYDGRRRQTSSRASLRKRLDATVTWDAVRRRRNQRTDMKGPFEFGGDRRRAEEFLPNIHSAMFPITQQNIYSPMPINSQMTNRETLTSPVERRNDRSHDYYQLLNNQTSPSRYPTYETSADYTSPQRHQRQQHLQAMTGNSPTVLTSTSANIPQTFEDPSNSFQEESRLINDEQAINQQMSGLQLKDDVGDYHRVTTSTRASKSTVISNNDQRPVAAIRRRVPAQTNNLKRSTERDESKIAHQVASSSKAKASSSSHQQRDAKSSKLRNPKATSARDNNNNSPPTKDCPICFERPINCVLYQCGHMCTCYECGVKQWRTQSRTCPICRTIIKDVIKTYMS